MTQTAVCDVQVDVQKLFIAILNELYEGSQCPCGIASKYNLCEKDLFPFLAELLAKEYIVLLLPDEYKTKNTHSTQQTPMELKLLVKSVRTQQRIKTNPYVLSQLWHDFFRQCKNIDNSLYYLLITDKGVNYLKNTISR